ncbi:MAG TPA: hypothetical protein VN362_12540 [Xanthobacteraceae bacterium]|nr:hypothetical protein [Xanthobacteraceae bacterium]
MAERRRRKRLAHGFDERVRPGDELRQICRTVGGMEDHRLRNVAPVIVGGPFRQALREFCGNHGARP